MDSGGADRSGLLRSMVLGARITRTLSSVDSPALAAIGNSNTVWRIFQSLADQRAVLPSVLADHLEVDRAIVSRSLNRLQALRLVNRRADPRDRRQVLVSLSARGTRLAREHQDAFRSVLEAAEDDIDALIVLAGREDASPPGPVPPLSACVERLALAGSRLVREFVENEAVFGLADWSQRFVLWGVAFGADAEELPRLLNLSPELSTAAIDALRDAGLMSESTNAALSPVELSPRGSQLLELEMGSFDAHHVTMADAFLAVKAAAQPAVMT